MPKLSSGYTLRGYEIKWYNRQTLEITYENHSSTLFQLPAEIRLMIYQSLVEKFDFRQWSATLESQPLIMLASTCRSLYIESRPFCLSKTIIDVKVPIKRAGSNQMIQNLDTTLNRVKALRFGADCHNAINYMAVRMTLPTLPKTYLGVGLKKVSLASGLLSRPTIPALSKARYRLDANNLAFGMSMLVATMIFDLPNLRELLLVLPFKKRRQSLDSPNNVCTMIAIELLFGLQPLAEKGRHIAVRLCRVVHTLVPEYAVLCLIKGHCEMRCRHGRHLVRPSKVDNPSLLTITVIPDTKHNVGFCPWLGQ
ncbi:hypothetical protein BT63DRAFT_414247 [Microthyrium microscopicum]|uniref:Uncharacterized protein n=1 Tax=Microthyrium microscopicum TaxID=703497 RepID=A0A6A6UA88_9PEZI|nr:hypothetical protein BT63DRAFT_414247 [Microthyrium microscopicum]